MVRGKFIGKSLVALVLLLSLALVASACGDDVDEEDVAQLLPVSTEAPATETVAEEEPEEAVAIAEPEEAEEVMEEVVQARGVLRERHNTAYAGVANMDPADPARWWPPIMIVYDKPLGIDYDGVPRPIIMTEWTVDETAKRWTFGIRDDVTFSDGSPLTSRDVAYTFEHYTDPNVGGQLMSILSVIDRDNIEVPDDATLILNLNKPHVDIPVLFRHYSMRVIPDESGSTIKDNPIGSGPFLVEYLSYDGVSRFPARDDYWLGTPGVEMIEIIGIGDQQAVVNAVLAGQLEMARGLSIAQAQLFEGNDDFWLQENSAGSLQAMVMIVTEPPFDDVRVREALKRVVDPEEMIAVVMQGHAVPACNNMVYPIDQYYLSQDCPQDIEGARQLLAEAGYPDGLTVELGVSDLAEVWTPIATIYKEQAILAGITIDIKQYPSDGYWTYPWMVEPFVHSNWGYTDADSMMGQAFRCGAAWNETFWCNDVFEATMDAAQAERDFDTRKALYQEAQQLTVDDGGEVVVFVSNGIRVVTNRMQGLDPRVLWSEYPWHEFTVDP